MLILAVTIISPSWGDFRFYLAFTHTMRYTGGDGHSFFEKNNTAGAEFLIFERQTFAGGGY